jgi:hypothetical protein
MLRKINENLNLIETGGRTLLQIYEGGDSLRFDPPLRVDWSVYCDKSHPAGDVTTAYITFDFGLEYQINPISTKNSGWGYHGINEDSSIEEVTVSVIRYDLFHAFCHYQGDPNYTHLHWALYGNLKDRCKIVEKMD